jgi:hypothetical protein
VTTIAGDKPCEASQIFDRPEKAKTIAAAIWIRTDYPNAVTVQMRQANSGRHKGEVIGEFGPRLSHTWERVVVTARPLDETKQVQFVLRIVGAATVNADEAKLYYTSEGDWRFPMPVLTYEQVLVAVDALREMALGGCTRSHLQQLIGDGPCGVMTSNGESKDLSKSLEFFNGAHGNKIVKVDCKTETFGYYSNSNQWANDFNALAPDRPDIPMLGCMASKNDKTLYLLLVNRTSDCGIDVKVNLGAEPASKSAAVRTLSGTDIDLPGATINESTTNVAKSFVERVEPYTARIMTIKMK